MSNYGSMLTLKLTLTVVSVSGIGFVAAAVLPEEAAVDVAAAAVFGSVVAVAVVAVLSVVVFA